jgi:hypothetical protein
LTHQQPWKILAFSTDWSNLVGIVRMVNLAAERHGQTDGDRSLADSGRSLADSDRQGPSVQGSLEKVSAYIPSEVIGIYVAGLGIFAPDHVHAKWILFGVSLILVPVLVLVGQAVARKRGLPAPPGKASIVVILFAVVAFCAWAAAMPSNPLLDQFPEATRVGGFAVIILAALLPQAANLLDITPKPYV